ncbi:MAG TPA: alcohol dehydrogenase catalytic domain-containing protein, partial [Candidatus Limnocylindria bacterium]|nr:alcohol dehydrogenase catalytic domain-containing protein [Candidatus Limnocylindria bacterium]
MTATATRTMRALAKTRPAPGAELIEQPVPSPGPGEVLLRMEAASICGTDAHLYNWDPWAAEILKPPIILGHELAGRVVGAGEGVTRVRDGDLVGVESHIVDWTCTQCSSGQAHLCRNLKVIGAHVDGGFAEYVVIPEANAIESNGLDPAVVALQEPMGNAVHAAFVEPIEGRTVAVTGCGPIGLCAVAVAEAAGASLVIATDVEPYRLDMAGRMGADLVIDGRQADLVPRVLEATGGDGVEVVLEMSGAQPALDTALAIITRGGRISLLGIFSQPARVDLSDLVIQKGVRLYGIYGRRLYDTWERTQALLRGGLDVTPIITHRFDL